MAGEEDGGVATPIASGADQPSRNAEICCLENACVESALVLAYSTRKTGIGLAKFAASTS